MGTDKRSFGKVLFAVLTLFHIGTATLVHAAPAPTAESNLIDTCLDLKTLGKCTAVLWQQGGLVLVLLAALAILALVLTRGYLQGWIEALKELGRSHARKVDSHGALSDATRRYLEAYIEDHRHFRFRGLDTRARGVDPPELDQAFVSVSMMAEAEHAEEPSAAGNPTTAASISEQGPAESIDLVRAVGGSSRLAIIGGAGSGKSTLLQWAGLAAARARLGQQVSPQQGELLTAFGSDNLVPILVSLLEFNRDCKKRDQERSPAALLSFMTEHATRQHPTIVLSSEFFHEQLRRGCLLMFDGIDEVDPSDRALVRETIEGLVRERENSPANQYLVTSRAPAYFGTAEVSGFRKCRVQNLTPEQRDALIYAWYRAVQPRNRDEAQRQALGLCARIAASPERVRALAVTPLMVTIFALVHYDRRDLPRQRAELYEHAVRILLTRPYAITEATAEPREDGEIQRNRLAFIAFELHKLGDRGDRLPEDELLDLAWPVFGADEKAARLAAREFAHSVVDRGGLLEEENGRYGFYSHRTFREFLAGRYLGEEVPASEQRDFLSERLEHDHWEEPVRLAAGYLAMHGERRANEFVSLLSGLGWGDTGRALALTRAGLALSDLPARSVQIDISRTVSERMVELLVANPPVIEVRIRRRLGLALGAVGDPRFRGPTAPILMRVPGGPFHMGTTADEAEKLKSWQFQVESDEIADDQMVHVSDFEIGKYVVTNTEFRAFWEAEGYEQEKYWSRDGWRWRRGELVLDLSYIVDETTRQRVQNRIGGRSVQKRAQPAFSEDPDWNVPNLPVVGVTWFEAEAYCNWLSAVSERQ